MKQQISFQEIEQYMAPYERFFSRTEARELAAHYVLGLIIDAPRKSIEPMAKRVGASERSLQRLLTEVKWDHSGVYEAYLKGMIDRYTDACGVLAAGQTVFPKRGGHSVCVARMYSEDLGKKVSSQMALDLIYVGQKAAWPVSMELYIPRFWDRPRDIQSRARRQKARMPADARHREQWVMALDRIKQVRSAGLNPAEVYGGIIFGEESGFRDGLDQCGQGYLVEIHPDFEVFLEEPVLRQDISKLRKRGRPRKRHRLMDAEIPPVIVSELFHGPAKNRKRSAPDHRDLAVNDEEVNTSIRVWPAHGYRDGVVHEPVWLLSGHDDTSAGGKAPRYYLSNDSKGLQAFKPDLMGEACSRAYLCKQRMINELGLLHHEGRSWVGWHRHVLMVFLAWAFLLEKDMTGKRPA